MESLQFSFQKWWTNPAQGIRYWISIRLPKHHTSNSKVFPLLATNNNHFPRHLLIPFISLDSIITCVEIFVASTTTINKTSGKYYHLCSSDTDKLTTGLSTHHCRMLSLALHHKVYCLNHYPPISMLLLCRRANNLTALSQSLSSMNPHFCQMNRLSF